MKKLPPVPVPRSVADIAEILAQAALAYDFLKTVATFRDPLDKHLKVKPSDAKQNLGSLIKSARQRIDQIGPNFEEQLNRARQTGVPS